MASVVVTLKGSLTSRMSVGGVLEDWIVNIENVSGGKVDDQLTGDAGANTLRGNGGSDVLKGGGGDDVLNGGAGDDLLTGGVGTGSRDTFLFDTAISPTANIDTITDFQVAYDQILLDERVFRGLGVGSADGTPINADAFHVKGTAGHDAEDRIIYDKAAGALFYDADGSLTDSIPIQFAVFTSATKPALTTADFEVM